MSSFAPPIVRDGWVYHDALYVDVGNLNRHPRGTISELTQLLRPELASSKKKPSKSSPSASAATGPPKDQVGHWYQAQLKHYGLPQTKDKNAAKVRLLQALNAGTLKVPESVLQVEKEMKKEYEGSNRREKARLKKEMGDAKGPVDEHSKKRKRDDGTKAESKKKGKKEKTETIDPPRKSYAAIASPATAARLHAARAAAIEAGETPPRGPIAVGQRSGDTVATARTKQTARRGGLGGLRKTATNRDTKKIANKDDKPATEKKTSKPKQTAKGGPAIQQSKMSSKKGQASPAKNFTSKATNNAGSKLKQASTKPQPSSSNVLASTEPHSEDFTPSPEPRGPPNGYEISCQVLEEDLLQPDDPSPTLRFVEEGECDAFWSRFHWGPFDGVIQIRPHPACLSDSIPVTFGWRARNVDTGDARFGRGCNGRIYFNTDRSITGTFFNLFGDEMDFYGEPWWDHDRMDVDGEQAELLEGCMRHWDSLPEEAYGRR